MIEKTKKLYEKLLFIRMVEERIADEYSNQEMRCPVHLSIGQEAIAVGVCENLTKNDVVYSNHRCHAHYLAKGGNLDKMIAEIYGKETGCCKGKGGSMHLIDLDAGFGGATPIVGNTIPIAVGAAFSKKTKKEKGVSVVFFGDGAMEEGVIHESSNFASLKKLPVLFICENNLYSVYTSLSDRQPLQRELYKLADAHNIFSEKADGNDAEIVFDKTKNALNHMKNSCGPAFLEFTTYRWREHCGPNYDNDIGYRTQEEFKEWKLKDPLKKIEKQVLERKVLSEKQLFEIKKRINQKIDDSFRFAKSSPFPGQEALYAGLYSE